MEADFVTNGMVIDDASMADDNAINVNSTVSFPLGFSYLLTLELGSKGTSKDLVIEGDRCGICMDVVIDRGVLDCCQHWFCFACIDNWASITNLCPLCQNEFQLITCVPVFDTIGSNKVEDDSFSRDDDWSIEGKNNTLSFPSYYIDENAVICLDGDGCKIRSGSATTEGDSGLDTSIACDSCDIWYHAFCVGFDTEGTSDITWLCPRRCFRCVPDEVTERMDASSLERTTMEFNKENGNNECQAEESFSGKVSVSVADTGETAVVVSLVEGNQYPPASSGKGLSPLEVNKNPISESCVSISSTNSHQSKTEKTTASSMEEQELELSLSHNVFCSLPSNSLGPDDLEKSSFEERSEPSSSSGTKILNESYDRTSPSRNESDMGLHLVDDIDKNATKDQETDIRQLSSEELILEGDEIEPNAHKDNARVLGRKRKHVDYSNDQVHVEIDDRDAKPEPAVEELQKKPRADGSQLINHKDSADPPLSDTKKNCSFEAVSRDEDLKRHLTKKNASSDIMSIVKGTNRKPSKGLSGTKSCNKSSKNNENMAGLRVKKIMKRAPDRGESSLVVENLREEIREAVRNNSSKNFGENLFDTKLLAAFRAAIAGPKTEPVNKLTPVALKAKKSMLQKGKVREHLTKKIFATSNGRRKRAWDRDCEIEFWKYRCMREPKPEKIETLKSVLNLLRGSSQGPESNEAPECQSKNPILSRLYLADTSVFPRKDDVKPLSSLKTAADLEQNKQHNPSAKASNQSLGNSTIKATEINNVLPKAGACSSENKVNKKIVNGSIGGNSTSGKVHLSRHSEGTSVSSSGGSKVDKKETGVKSDCIKSDKRKWAMEVLARKTAATGKKTSNENQEDNAILKGNYPLLAQLPADMRPVLAPSHHNKIPISVRQTQLYRLTEHFLRNANLSVVRRTADTELAVADAINIEKEVADRSNSKLVYMNLCSQELLHRSNKKSNVATDTSPQVSSAALADRSEQNTDDGSEQNTDDPSTDTAVEIALKNAGLLSDSPPCSPHEKSEISIKEDDLSGPDNILELDSHPEMDIYGDFEYDLEDEDYIGASAAKVLNSQEEESETKLKLIFSTMNLKNSETALDCADSERLENNGVSQDASCSSNQYDAGNKDSTIDSEIGKSSVSSEGLFSEGAVEPVDTEFEELYGPDKEPLALKFPDVKLRTLHGEDKTETFTEGSDSHKKEQIPDQAVNASESRNDNLARNAVENCRKKGEKCDTTAEQSDSAIHVTKKVEAYIKEHIRPLFKSGVITAEQYRWAVTKTTEKVMKYHSKAKNANFLIKEGEKVKKLAEQRCIETDVFRLKNCKLLILESTPFTFLIKLRLEVLNGLSLEFDAKGHAVQSN
ncbi:uncharacterized protein G2W53_019289 [Senna tora]|uniref:RING-type domain-containing protein n=1 Tax=Senna tora TaxID=362788 RepID=A0A834WLV4_9FABA|nr:uncharacterized protein G2W53_019289 [Senna tora]